MAQLLFFLYFSGMALFSSVLTIGLRNPIYCTLALLSTFLHVAGLFVLLHAEFLAAIQIIIYAGAVLILYLFVLMLLDLKSSEGVLHRQTWLALFFGLVILAEILIVLFKSPTLEGSAPGAAALPAVGNTEAIGLSLFNEYLLPFEMVGVILLGGIIGALVLAKQPRPDAKMGGNGAHALEVPLPRTGNGHPEGTPDSVTEEARRGALDKIGSS
ncbi:NADH-quinone oxidoreductase subunit J [Candidatus Manganitrophus noduliformans]|uniref:NADH-quinone oxidoreductase subunit J n=1 Tax=Candidatus Manganitrophus noduliformans TaxID=2606439 RepID=A0A7X6DNR6_9BACT|nr:NADH-quinone oxidoreductase subunit J [Candidatus Manganitrophus noduliformans]NKE70636.1 NADH-quinone oxidoreductase subunit J [Candidatus Manganitrophus noduliformans]